MHITLLLAVCQAGCLFSSLPLCAREKDKLTLIMKQLDQFQYSLERARVVSILHEHDDRFYFDYLRSTQDNSTMPGDCFIWNILGPALGIPYL